MDYNVERRWEGPPAHVFSSKGRGAQPQPRAEARQTPTLTDGGAGSRGSYGRTAAAA